MEEENNCKYAKKFLGGYACGKGAKACPYGNKVEGPVRFDEEVFVCPSKGLAEKVQEAEVKSTR